MLKYKVCNLVTAIVSGEISNAGQGCNCQQRMYSGVAKWLAEAFPTIRAADNATWNPADPEGALKLGTFSAAEAAACTVYNLYTQQYYGTDTRKLHYGALANALVAMREDIIKKGERHYPIGFPKIGSHLAGGDWDGVISELIEGIFKGFDVTIYVLNESELPLHLQKAVTPKVVVENQLEALANSNSTLGLQTPSDVHPTLTTTEEGKPAVGIAFTPSDNINTTPPRKPGRPAKSPNLYKPG